MNMLPNVADFRYLLDSPIAYDALCRELELVTNPHDINLSIWKDGELRGVVVYSRYTKAAIFMHVAGFTHNWGTKKFLRMAFDYPFNQLGVDRLFGLVNSKNTSALKFFNKLGFVVETTIKGVYPNGDECVVVLEKQNCKWLKLKV